MLENLKAVGVGTEHIQILKAFRGDRNDYGRR